MTTRPPHDFLRPLDLPAITGGICSGPIGRDLRYVATVDSTNHLAMRLPSGTWQDGTVIIADYQERGRGRHGRTWVAPPNSSLLLSILLALPQQQAPDVSMLGGLAVAEAVAEVTGCSPYLKWPNDVLLRGRKVGGILGESLRDGGLVLGIGINVNIDPAGGHLPPEATSLWAELGAPVRRERLAAALFNSANLWYRDLTHDAARVFAAWSARLQTIGRPVVVRERHSYWRGIATGVQRDGALLVRDDGGKVRAVYAADVSIRRAPDFTSR